MLTSQYDNMRTGADLHETTLIPDNVNPRQFGKLFVRQVDGAIYAQPLYMPRLEIPGKGVHNVVFVATEADSVYAFDADGHPADPLWKASLADRGKGVSPVTAGDVLCPFIDPVIGITSTPVIDLATGTLYVLARTRESTGFFSSPRFVQKLHGLAVTTGVEKFGGPVTIQASVKGRGDGSSQGQIDFDPLRENPRAALLLANGKVYLSWASSCDVGAYHGWIISYDAGSLKQVSVFNATPDDGQGGVWAADTGPAADNEGNVFVATGNGGFDADRGGRDYGDTLLKLDGSSLQIRDYFTPFNQKALNDNDDDLGSGGPVLLPDRSGVHAHVVIMAGKGGILYAVDRGRMGHFHAEGDSNVIETVELAGGAFGAPAYWNHHVYSLVHNDGLRDFRLEKGLLKPVAQSRRLFFDAGATPTVSANGTTSGIVWILSSKRWNERDGRPAVLCAFDAANVSRELYTSEQNSSRDRAGVGLRFNIPTVANGRVYVGAKGELDVYGLLEAGGRH